MNFQEWERQNGMAIVTRWIDWCDYAIKYSQHFSANYEIPVPQFFLDAYMKGIQPGGQIKAYFQSEFAKGTPVPMPPPAPTSPPSQNKLGRSFQQGQASQTYGEAARRGFVEGFLGSLFRRR